MTPEHAPKSSEMTASEICEAISRLCDKDDVHIVYWFITDLVIDRYCTPSQQQTAKGNPPKVHSAP